MSSVAFVVCGPSGVGKATIIRRVLKRVPNLRLVRSCTTRSPRPDDQHLGKYIFVGREEFEQMIEKKEFLEWAQVHGHYYGTPLSEFGAAEDTGQDLILELDVQGARAAQRLLDDVVVAFVTAPDFEVLRQRLERRSPGSTQDIEVRMRTARTEMNHQFDFDYWVVNDELEDAIEVVQAIIIAERQRARRAKATARIPSPEGIVGGEGSEQAYK